MDFMDHLENLRKRLLDLSLNNRLINYKATKSSSLQIIDELPDQIYDHLIVSKKAFTFGPLSPLLGDDIELAFDSELPHPSTNDDDIADRHIDDKLLLNLPSQSDIQRVTQNIYRKARTAIEETGVNILYLCLGMLEWSPADHSEEKYKAPLLLIPVRLEALPATHNSKKKNYCIIYTGEEIVENICLQKKTGI